VNNLVIWLATVQHLKSKGVNIDPYLDRIESIVNRDPYHYTNIFNKPKEKGTTYSLDILPNYGHRQPIKQRDPREPKMLQKLKLERWIQDIFVRRFKEQLKQLRAEYKAAKPKKIPKPRNEKDYVDELISALLTGAGEGIDLFTRRISIGMDLTKPNENAAKWARDYAYELIKGIDETSLKLVQDAISGFVEGGTIGDIIDALAPEFGDIRASTIAVTETTRAFAEGQKLGADQMLAEFPDVAIYKTWFTNNDDIVCDDCGPLDGVEVPMDESFGEVDAPPYHVNCRCWIDYNTKLGNNA
jgi:hypothetical protein